LEVSVKVVVHPKEEELPRPTTRLNGMLHVIIPHPEKKHKDCIVRSKCQVEGRKQHTFVKHVIVNQVFMWERV
jgi:hypothetical protein